MPDYTTGTSSTKPDGEYNFTTENAKEKESKNKNAMIELKHQLEGGGVVYDNLVFVESCFEKIDDYRKATGEKIEPGVTASFEAEDCIGRHGRLELGTEIYEGRSRNRVLRYIETAGPPPVNENGEPTEIPF